MKKGSRESMNKKTLLLSVVICIIGGMIGLTIKNIYHHYQFQKIYQNLFEEKQTNIIFLERPTCGFCNLFKPILQEASKNYNFQYQDINVDWLTKKELEKILEKLHIRKTSFSTPRLIITEGNNIKDQQIGYMDDLELFNYLKKNGITNQSFKNAYPKIERLTSESYFKLLEEKENALVLIGRIGDPKVTTLLNKNTNIKLLNPAVFTKEEKQKFDETVTLTDDMKLPILLEIKNGKIMKITDDAK